MLLKLLYILRTLVTSTEYSNFPPKHLEPHLGSFEISTILSHLNAACKSTLPTPKGFYWVCFLSRKTSISLWLALNAAVKTASCFSQSQTQALELVAPGARRPQNG